MDAVSYTTGWKEGFQSGWEKGYAQGLEASTSTTSSSSPMTPSLQSLSSNAYHSPSSNAYHSPSSNSFQFPLPQHHAPMSHLFQALPLATVPPNHVAVHAAAPTNHVAQRLDQHAPADSKSNDCDSVSTVKPKKEVKFTANEAEVVITACLLQQGTNRGNLSKLGAKSVAAKSDEKKVMAIYDQLTLCGAWINVRPKYWKMKESIWSKKKDWKVKSLSELKVVGIDIDAFDKIATPWKQAVSKLEENLVVFGKKKARAPPTDKRKLEDIDSESDAAEKSHDPNKNKNKKMKVEAHSNAVVDINLASETSNEDDLEDELKLSKTQSEL